MEWFFDGLGTEIIGLLIGAIVGGVSGYKIGIRKNKISQKQKARDGANQSQIGIQTNGEE